MSILTVTSASTAARTAAVVETEGLTGSEVSQLAYEAVIAKPAQPGRATALCSIAADLRAARLAAGIPW
jgi:hypothetical protein